eukprot:m.16832 g.16832  ORF g.16832 m.16832 type:complete len:858 (-) comp3429_c0_seq1:130-2703(-)
MNEAVWDADTQPGEDDSGHAITVTVLHAPPSGTTMVTATRYTDPDIAWVVEPATAIPHRLKKRTLNELKRGARHTVVQWPPLGRTPVRTSFAEGIRTGLTQLAAPVCNAPLTIAFHAFQPRGGAAQLEWEWVTRRAHQVLVSPEDHGDAGMGHDAIVPSVGELESGLEWIKASRLDVTTSTGNAFCGYDTVTLDMYAVHLDESLPTLMLEWWALVTYSEAKGPPVLRHDVVAVLGQWLEGHATGQVVVVGDPGGRWRSMHAQQADDMWSDCCKQAVDTLGNVASTIGRHVYYHFTMPGTMIVSSPTVHVMAWLQHVHSIALAQSVFIYAGDMAPWVSELCKLTGMQSWEASDFATDAISVNAVRVSTALTRVDFLSTRADTDAYSSHGSSSTRTLSHHRTNNTLAHDDVHHRLLEHRIVADGRVHGVVESTEVVPSTRVSTSVAHSAPASSVSAPPSPSDGRAHMASSLWHCQACDLDVREESCPFCDNTRETSTNSAVDDMDSNRMASVPLTSVPVLTTEGVEAYARENNSSRVPDDKLLERGMALMKSGDIPPPRVHDAVKKTVRVIVYPNDKQYDVRVTFGDATDSGRPPIADHSCSCPMGEQGTACKHVVGLLYAMSNAAVSTKASSQPAGGSTSSGSHQPVHTAAPQSRTKSPDHPNHSSKRSLSFLSKTTATSGTKRDGGSKSSPKRMTPNDLREWATSYLAAKDVKTTSQPETKRAGAPGKRRARQPPVDAEDDSSDTRPTQNKDSSSKRPHLGTTENVKRAHQQPHSHGSGDASHSELDSDNPKVQTVAPSRGEHTTTSTCPSNPTTTSTAPVVMSTAAAAAAAAAMPHPPAKKPKTKSLVDAMLDDFL